MSNPTMFKSTFVLTLVCLIASALLGATYLVTAEKIDQQAVIALNENLRQVFPEADDFEESASYFMAKKQGMIIGFASVVETSGYGGTIKLLVGIDTQRKLTGVRIMDHTETPGLGANAVKPEFYNQFNSLTFDKLSLKKEAGEIDAITGATITTNAVIEGVKTAYYEVGDSVTTDSIIGATIASANNNNQNKSNTEGYMQ